MTSKACGVASEAAGRRRAAGSPHAVGMAAGEKKKPPAAAPKKPPPPKSDAYLQLSPWLPATVCLRSAQHQWALCRDEVERKAREENAKVVKERREKACE